VRTRDRAIKRVVEMLALFSTVECAAIVPTHAQPERIAELRVLAGDLLSQSDTLTEQ